MKLEFKYGCPEKMEGKTLVEYLENNEWTSNIKTGNKYIAINSSDIFKFICFNDSLDQTIRYKISPKEKILYLENGVALRSPYYDAQKSQIHILANNNQGLPLTEEEVLKEFIKEGYSINQNA